jgi:hypothetical protein
VSLHSAFTIHGSFSNRTPIGRRTLVAHVASSACRLRESHLPNSVREHFPAFDGSPLPASHFPPLPTSIQPSAEKRR